MVNWWVELSRRVSPEFSIWIFQFYWYGILVGLGVLAGIQIVRKTSKHIGSSVFWCVLAGGVIGARIYHVLDYWEIYSAHLPQIFNLGSGGLGIFGAIGGGGIGVWIYCRVKGKSVLDLWDSLAIGVPLSQGIGRWGNFFNQEGFGGPTELPWKIYIPPELRPDIYVENSYFHPVFLYESVLNLVLFLFMLKVINKRGGMGLSGIYLIGYGTIRFIVEFLRIDTWSYGGLKVAWLLSVLAIVAGWAIMYARRVTK